MSIFPFIDASEVESPEKEIPLAKEYAYDFDKGDFKTKNGKPYLVEGEEAVKLWIHKALITNRYKELIHTWDYGSELEDQIIGRGFTFGIIESEARRYITECIEASLSDYVTELKDFDITFKKGTLTIEFIAITIYGEVNIFV